MTLAGNRRSFFMSLPAGLHEKDFFQCHSDRSIKQDLRSVYRDPCLYICYFLRHCVTAGPSLQGGLPFPPEDPAAPKHKHAAQTKRKSPPAESVNEKCIDWLYLILIVWFVTNFLLFCTLISYIYIFYTIIFVWILNIFNILQDSYWLIMTKIVN